jgi:hypothetical protein
VIAFRALLAIDLLTAGVFAWFFLVGLSDGSVGAFNMGLWLGILGGLAAVIGGGIALHRRGARALATGLLAVVGVPALLGGLLFLSLIIINPSFK